MGARPNDRAGGGGALAGGSGAIRLTQPVPGAGATMPGTAGAARCGIARLLHCGRDLPQMLCERARNEAFGRDEGTPPRT